MSLRHASSIHNSDFNDQDSAIPYQLILNSTKWDFSNDAKTIQCALDVDKNDVAIKQATLTINDLEMTIANILKIKAIACAKKEQYDKEFQDKTIFMNKVVSVHHDPEEYLLDGRRYAEQGLQKQAIQMFNKGLELQRLAEKEDPHCYYELTSERNQAQTRLDSRIDFFARFPYDIVCRVIDFIPLETIVQCSRVSSLWRTLILDCPNPWRHIDTHILTKSGISLPFKFLPLISHHVESLVLPQNGQGILCMSAIRTINLPKFRSLYIKDADARQKENYYTNICSALANVSKTLTTLDVSFGWRETDDEFRLYHILSAFQNLTSLRIHAPRNRFLVGSSMPIAGIHRLTKLTLDTIIDPVGLKMVLETFPYLRWLSLPTHDDMTFRSIQQYGTNSINVLLTGGLPDALTCGGLLLSRKFSWLIPDEEKFLNNNDGSSSNQGIRWLSTGFIRSEREAGSSIVTYIEAHHATIQILSLNMIKDFSDATHWHSLCSSEQTLVHLTHLNLEAIEDDDDHDYTIFPDLELLLNNQVPNLQVFSLFSVADRMTKGTFDALGNIQTLRELWLRDVTFDAYDLNKFLNDMASKQSSLTGLCLIQCDDNMDDHILETCTRIQSLSHLIIQNHWATQPECIRKFIQNVASALPKLKELSLHQFNLTPKDLQVLNNSSTLKSVEFSAVVGVDEDQVKESFSSPSIQVKFMSAETYFNIYTPI